MARTIVERLSPPTHTPLVAFAFRHRVLNTNSVNLAALLVYQHLIPMTQLDADEGDSVAAYVRQLREPELGRPELVATTSIEAGDFEPVVTQARVEEAARRLGFRCMETMRLPDGRQLRLWRKHARPSCSKRLSRPSCRPRSGRRPAEHARRGERIRSG